ncbi:helix-turn-helix domain-containing protein [Bradyrhizobium sp. 40]|uniref:helix-turn-helix domain-containing protein n=1 Tax=Bradyrhizobium sp. 40 TaxID=2782674 RepID=UPI001FFFA7B6|nr:helix-turn-helix domain-containing protein [Bradyrhizobium sp. 40]UPJ41945.1 helix-turn-helix domain-containing protein [Bradyrhizobium sp. 40]
MQTPETDQPSQIAKLAYTPEEAAAATGRSRTRIYKAVRDKELTARKDGKRTVFEATELKRWLHELPAIGREATAA